MSEDNRFSIFILEKDVLEYNYYKKKFDEYTNKVNSWWRYPFRNSDMQYKMDFYNKYIMKLRFLEKHYRKTNIYTRYHEELEQPYAKETPVVARLVTSPIYPDDSK
mgnify:CR=1 FL=1|tara:strand:- start:897 stop:1214 length:318 start_codon:yes stop_codon:yes gene_type:complete